ncbi:hypothetical protein Tco_1203955 [Tanacetum coccineum]
MEKVDQFCIKNCWGNLSFKFVCGPSIGNSGGILCVWDPRMFPKHNSTVSDYFVDVQGDWIPSAKKCLIISIYAPQECSEKKMLWSYLNKCLIMSSLSGEVDCEVSLGRVRPFLWGLDVINAEREGFDKFIGDTWSNANISDDNAINKFMKKMRFLKEQIRGWVRSKKEKDCMTRSNLIVMESLHISFQNVVLEGLFKGVSVNSSLNLSHLFYADDVIFMGQWSESNINTIIQALDCFHKASGLRMNLHKSKIMGIAVDDEIVVRAANKMGCSSLKTPFSYLGIKVGGSMSRKDSWNDIVDNLRSRLSKWKMKTLSIGGE